MKMRRDCELNGRFNKKCLREKEKRRKIVRGVGLSRFFFNHKIFPGIVRISVGSIAYTNYPWAQVFCKGYIGSLANLLSYCIVSTVRRLGAGFSFFSLSHPSFPRPSTSHPITKVRYIRFFLAPTLDCQDRLYKLVQAQDIRRQKPVPFLEATKLV